MISMRGLLGFGLLFWVFVFAALTGRTWLIGLDSVVILAALVCTISGLDTNPSLEGDPFE